MSYLRSHSALLTENYSKRFQSSASLGKTLLEKNLLRTARTSTCNPSRTDADDNNVERQNSRKRRSYCTSSQCLGKPKVLELIKAFPSGVKKLSSDYQTYKNINDASRTKYNAWSSQSLKQQPTNMISDTSTNTGTSTRVVDNIRARSCIPRRQQEQQKRFIRDFKKVILPVTIVQIPGGTVFLPLIAISPQTFLSNHFFTDDQIRYFVSNEYYHRRAYFISCANDIWMTLISHPQFKSSSSNEMFQKLEVLKYDNAGPVFKNVMVLYSLFKNHFGQQRNGQYVYKLNCLPRGQVMNIALSSSLTSPTLSLQPSVLIQRRLTTLAQNIIQDDINLIREGYHFMGRESCNKSLSLHEVIETCAVRGLPCGLDQDADDMRESLTGHLIMMKQVIDEVGIEGLHSVEAEQFILHLSVIRQNFSKH
jgi:hypothetical protein